MDDEPPSQEIPRPNQPRASQKWQLTAALLYSLAINGAIAVILFFIVVGGTRYPVPLLQAHVGAEPESPHEIEDLKLDRQKVAPASGGSPMSAAIPVISEAFSTVSLTVPDVSSLDTGVIDGFGSSMAFGDGTGSGNGSGSGAGLGGLGFGSAKVGNLMVKAQRLGVVLDVSGSMQGDLPKVKRELRRAFRNAETVEVNGCHLRDIGVLKPNREIRLEKEAPSVLEAMEMLIVDGRVDAIYWFSDLQDGENEGGLAFLGQLLRIDGARSDRSVKLYVRSLEREPSLELRSVIKRSGGEIQIDGRSK